jgi:hypothetical protein
MKRFKTREVYVTFIMFIVSVLFITGCGGSDEAALLIAEQDSVNPGSCTVAGPKVTLSNIIDGTNSVPTNTTITATFSEPMDPTTIQVTDSTNPEVLTFTLKAHGQVVNVHGTVAMDITHMVATFTPDAVLDINTEYTATITTYAKNAGGAELSCSYRWSFTTVR